ncbi:adenylyl-sulfate kinase [Paenibacillus doosanensis]|uniref:adenylyl-sulfate kinase n=1 Tax=Paenibacillus doosanensis TaxID=1229154 RepID=UPI00217F86A0|nr:adenylyl-sulfate kinase [Paenibacillus doosanensis]MCS7464013.1 adenylyl-sulfate kinase [Paenibacillus doosanensis]
MKVQPKRHPYAIWLTGLPSSGKTTTALALAGALRSEGIPVECLDGDELRKHIGGGLGFSRGDRMENVRRAAYVSGLLNRNQVTTVVSMITPYEEMREYLRRELPHYIEVYVECQLEECVRRDVKGLYAKAQRGEIPAFTGISDVYEPPRRPDVVIRTDRSGKEDNVRIIMDYIALCSPSV